MASAIQIIGSLILASIPAILWGFFFYKKNPEDKKMLLLTFIIGSLAVFPILLYKFSWQFFPWLNAFRIAERFEGTDIIFSSLLILPASVVVTFMIVGIIEELMKLFSVKIVNDERFDSIDDSMEFFIIAALGFSFMENILYFYNIWFTQGASDLLIPFLFRSSFSTFAHILFSGVLGYYYGVAHFAKPILQEEIKANRNHWTVWLHKIFALRKEKLFHQEKLFEGLIIAISLHAIFNIFLEINLSFLIVPFLLVGYQYLNHLFKTKNAHKDYKKLYTYRRNHSMTSHGMYFELKPIE